MNRTALQSTILNLLPFIVFLISGCASTQTQHKLTITRENCLYPNYKVAVLDLKMNIGSYDHDNPLWEKSVQYNAGRLIANQIEKILLEEKIFKIVERTYINKVLKEHKLNLSGITENDSEIISLLNADAIWVGQVNEFCTFKQIISIKGACSFSAKLVDIKSGEVLFLFHSNESAWGNYMDALEKAIEKFRIKVIQINLFK